MESDVWYDHFVSVGCDVTGDVIMIGPHASHCVVDLINVFDVFLPQLLMYPNPKDPLNREAAAMLIRDEKKYKERVAGAPDSLMNVLFVCNLSCAEYVKAYAQNVDIGGRNKAEESDSSTDGMSDGGEGGDEDVGDFFP